jgi:hypothetical protein
LLTKTKTKLERKIYDKYKKIDELKDIIKNSEQDASVKLYNTAKSLLSQLEGDD